jgi:hypothetical protein
MPARKATPVHAHPDRCFVAELPGENPPLFSELQKLYGLATELFALRPWQLLEDSQLTLVQAGPGGELCYCCVMGALGEVYAMHAYMGFESYRLHCDIQADGIVEPGEFFARQRSVYVEFVPRKELERQDRELLAWLHHPQGKGMLAPIFRACRPGFHPWFVNAEEARALAKCIAATIEICNAVAGGKGKKFWKHDGVFPLAVEEKKDASRYRIDLVKAELPEEPPIPPARANEEKLAQLRGRDYPVRGVMELDHILSGAPIGKKNERKSCASFALAVDAKSGIIYAPNATDSRVPPGDSLASVFIDAVQASRAFPQEVRVRTQKLSNCLAPLMESFGVAVRVSPKLPAADEARAHLLSFLSGVR